MICNHKTSSRLFYIYTVGQKEDYVHCSYSETQTNELVFITKV